MMKLGKNVFNLKSAAKGVGIAVSAGAVLALISTPALAQSTGFGALAENVAKNQGGGFLAAFLIFLQVVGAFMVGAALFMVIKHNKTNGQGQDTSWKMVAVLAIVGVMMVFFSGTMKKAEESVWSGQGDRTKITIR